MASMVSIACLFWKMIGWIWLVVGGGDVDEEDWEEEMDESVMYWFTRAAAWIEHSQVDPCCWGPLICCSMSAWNPKGGRTEHWGLYTDRGGEQALSEAAGRLPIICIPLSDCSFKNMESGSVSLRSRSKSKFAAEERS